MANSVLTDILSILRSKVLTILFGLGKAIIIARILGPEINGLLAAILVYPSLFMTIGALGVRKSSAYLLGSEKYDETSIKQGIIQSWFLSALFCIVSLFILLKFTSHIEHSYNIIFLAIAPIPFGLLNTYASGVYLGKNEIKKLNTVDWVPAAIAFLSVVLFVNLLNFSLVGALIGEILSQAIMSVILIFKLNLYRFVKFKVNWKLLKEMYGMGLSFAISLMVINLNYRVDIIIMEKLSSPAEMGIYSKGSVLTQYLWNVPMLLGTVVFSRGVRAKNKVNFSLKVCQLLRISLVISGVASVFLLLASGFLVNTLFGSAFNGSAIVMQYLVPGVLLLIIFKVLNMDMGSRGLPWFALKAMVPALVVNIGLNIWLIPEFGARGAAITSTISYMLGGLLFLYHYSKLTQIPVKKIFAFAVSDFDFAKPHLIKIKNLVKK